MQTQFATSTLQNMQTRKRCSSFHALSLKQANGGRKATLGLGAKQHRGLGGLPSPLEQATFWKRETGASCPSSVTITSPERVPSASKLKSAPFKTFTATLTEFNLAIMLPALERAVTAPLGLHWRCQATSPYDKKVAWPQHGLLIGASLISFWSLARGSFGSPFPGNH